MKTWVKRSVRTFIQAAVGYVAANITLCCSGVSDVGTMKNAAIGLITAAVAAGIAAAMNLKEE